MIEWVRNAGLNMMKSLGEGILAGIEWPFKAAEHVAEKIGGFFHFHSPPSYGPLREAILNFNFGEELAKHIKPIAVIGPSITMAAGIAAAPMIHSPFGGMAQPAALVMNRFGENVIHAAPIVMADGTTSRTADAAPSAAGMGGGIVIHYSPDITVNGGSGSPEDWVKAMRRHSDELMRVIDDKLNRRARLRFD